MCAWAYVSQCLPHNPATLQLQVLTSMQMGAYLKKEQIGTLYVLVGATEGGFRGWGGGAGGPAQESYVPIQNCFFWRLLLIGIILVNSTYVRASVCA